LIGTTRDQVCLTRLTSAGVMSGPFESASAAG
jgi:hypothetical protein